MIGGVLGIDPGPSGTFAVVDLQSQLVLVDDLPVSPKTCKRAMRLGADKEFARQKALERFPSAAAPFGRKADHNRAEAALLAAYALQERRS